MTEVEAQPPMQDATTGSVQSNSESSVRTSGQKRLSQAKEPKKSRSIFSQAFGTLQKAKADDTKPTEAVKKRREIDARIYGKINRDVNLVRRQDEAKRDRQSALRKEEELAVKDDIVKFRQECCPRLAGFLLTSDNIPPDSGEEKDDELEHESSEVPEEIPGAFGPAFKKPLNHPPPPHQPPALYFLPAILTPAQQKFLDKQKADAKDTMAFEQKEWDEKKKLGLFEVKSLRKQADEALAPLKFKEEEEQKEGEQSRKKNDEELAKAGVLPVPGADEEMEVESENTGTREMDAEEQIVY